MAAFSAKGIGSQATVPTMWHMNDSHNPYRPAFSLYRHYAIVAPTLQVFKNPEPATRRKTSEIHAGTHIRAARYLPVCIETVAPSPKLKTKNCAEFRVKMRTPTSVK
jgi:hypothetical protein